MTTSAEYRAGAPLVVTAAVRDLLARGREHRGYVVLRDGYDGPAVRDAARELEAYGALEPAGGVFAESTRVYKLTDGGEDLAAHEEGDA